MAGIIDTYAKSLYEVVLDEQKQTKEMLEQLAVVNQVFAENKEVYKLIATPILNKSERIDILDKLLGGKVDVLLLNFLKVLLENHKIGELPKVVKAFKGIYNRDNNILEVVAVTAKPLSENQREKLLEKLNKDTGKEIELSQKIDPSILGGLILKVENKEINASVRERLNDISRLIRA